MVRDEQRRGVRFELLGRPGSGKTTLLQGLPETVRTETLEGLCRSCPVRSAIERLVLAVRHPIWALLIYGVALGARRARVRALRNALSLQRRVAALDALPWDVSLVMDEGIVHGLFVTLDLSRPNAMSLFCVGKILELLVHEHNVVWIYVDVDAEECIRRFKKRSTASSRFDAETSPEKVDAFRTSKTYDELRALIADGFPERIRVVSDAESLLREIPQ